MRSLRTRSAPHGGTPLRWLMVSWGCWVTAEWASLIAVSVVGYDAAGAAGVGLVGAARVVPAALLGPLAGTVADRLPRPRALASVHLSWCLVSLSLAWVAATGAPLAVLLGVVGAGSLTSSVFKPCLNALVPQLVAGPRELIAANSTYAAVEATGTILGPVLAALLLTLLGPGATFLGLTAVFLAAGLASLQIDTAYQPGRAGPVAGLRWLSETSRGFTALVQPATLPVFGLFMGQTAMRGLLNVFVVVLALQQDASGRVGSFFAAIGVGGLVGAVAAARRAGGSVGDAQWFGLGVSLWGSAVLVIGLLPSAGVAWVALAVLGLGNALADVHGYTLLHRFVPYHLAGRAWGAYWSCCAGTVALGSLAAPVLIGALGLRSAMVLTGAALVLACALLLRRLRVVDALTAGRPADVALLTGVPFLSRMTPIGLELLARQANELDLPAGTPVTCEGDPGDRFYVVAAGALVVRQRGCEVRHLGPGDAFGEIALLDDVPRTATVTTAGDSRLLCIDRATFIGAVTGHRATEQAAHGTVARHLHEDADRSGRPRP